MDDPESEIFAERIVFRSASGRSHFDEGGFEQWVNAPACQRKVAELDPGADLRLAQAKEQAHHILGRIDAEVEQDEEPLRCGSPHWPWPPPPARRGVLRMRGRSMPLLSPDFPAPRRPHLALNFLKYLIEPYRPKAGGDGERARLPGLFSNDATPRTNEMKAQMNEDDFRRAWSSAFKPFAAK